MYIENLLFSNIFLWTSITSKAKPVMQIAWRNTNVYTCRDPVRLAMKLEMTSHSRCDVNRKAVSLCGVHRMYTLMTYAKNIVNVWKEQDRMIT